MQQWPPEQQPQQPQYPQQPPHPGPYYAPPPPPPPRPSNSLRLGDPGFLSPTKVVWLFLILIVVGVVAFASQNGSGGTSAAATPTPVRLGKVGDTLTASGVACTLLAVHTLPPGTFDQPKAGNVFVVVRVRIVNQSSATTAYFDADFHIKTSAGAITDAVIAPDSYTANDALDSGHLVQGGTITGDVFLEAPAHDHGAQLLWQPGDTPSDDLSHAWALGL